MPLNIAPIFLNAFSRGGSSLVWNVLQSHPDAASPLEETHQLFIGNADDGSNSRKSLVHLQHALRGGGLPRPRIVDGHILPNFGLLDPANYSHRRIPGALRSRLDESLFLAKQRNLHHPQFRFRTPSLEYSEHTLAETRLVAKNINGIVFLGDEFAAMYPDATFVGLVRNGLALCESRMRRRTFRSAHKFGTAFRLLVDELEAQADRLPHYRIFRFEDLLHDPGQFLADLYGHVGLDPNAVTHVRLKNKPHYVPGGEYGTVAGRADHYWVPVDDLPSYLNRDVDEEQRVRLDPADREEFLRAAASAMQRLQYA